MQTMVNQPTAMARIREVELAWSIGDDVDEPSAPAPDPSVPFEGCVGEDVGTVVPSPVVVGLVVGAEVDPAAGADVTTT